MTSLWLLLFMGQLVLSSQPKMLSPTLLSQAAWRTGACVLSGVLETVFGAEVYREGESEFGLYCDHVLRDRWGNKNITHEKHA